MVAEKLEPLIAAAAPLLGRGRRDMGQRALEDRLVGERVADPAFELRRGESSPSGSSNDREQPVPAHDPRPAPDLPGRLAVADREEDDLGAADDVVERHVADLAQHAAVGRIVAVVAHHEVVVGRHGVDRRVVVEASCRRDRACSR